MRTATLALRVAFLLFALLWVTEAGAACAGGNCFWIGGTGTLNLTSDSAHWATTSGASTCSCEPATTDTITFDGSSGGGTVTVNIAGGTWTAGALTLSAFTGTLDFSANNNNFTTIGAVDDNGTTATFNMGNGTWTLSGGAVFFRVAAGATFTANSSTLSFTSSSAGSRRLFGNGKTFNAVSVGANSAANVFVLPTSVTIGSFTVTAPNRVNITSGTTLTATTFNTVTGSSGSEVSFSADNLLNGTAAILSANNWTCTWCSVQFLTFSGGGTFTATNSFDLGGNTGITITAPSAGGGGRIIGG